jgi:hypothetical protein
MLQDLYKCIKRAGGEVSDFSNVIGRLSQVIDALPEACKDEALDHIIEFLKDQQSPTKM